MSSRTLEFQLLDLAFTDADKLVELYGRTADGRSVSLVVSEYCTSFYLHRDDGAVPQPETMAASLRLPIIDVQPVKRKTLYGYRPNAETFLQLTIGNPFLRGRVHSAITSNALPGFTPQTWNTSVDLFSLFLIHANLDSCGWVRARGCGPSNADSSCDVIASVASIEALEPLGSMPNAPVRILSLDIECCAPAGQFPDARRDPVIQVACVLEGQPKRDSVVFCLDETDDFHEPGVTVHSFETESGLLLELCSWIRATDPDLLTGYNIIAFDIPYLVNRAETLGIAHLFSLGRRPTEPTAARKSQFSSKGQGTYDTYQLTLSGRVVFDVLTLLKRDGQKLRSYKLNSVAQHYLGTTKDDVHHSEIAKLWKSGPEGRSRLAHYCWRDAVLPLDLIAKQYLFVNNVEQARVCCVPLNYLVTRGQQVKVMGQIAREAHRTGYVVPNMDSERGRAAASDEKYQGAIVLHARTGYYTDPVVVLDFAGLYPSIIRAHNLCYSTLIDKRDALVAGMQDGRDYITTPTGNCFVTPAIHKGLLPEILANLNEARNQAKRDMRNATDPHVRAIQNGRQLALKISANSVYGFCGATVGKLPCIAVAASTTAFGRDLIEQTKSVVEAVPFNADVVYGDTVRECVGIFF